MNPILYRYKDTESVIKRMDGYTPGEGWEPLYSQDQISSAVNAALKATAPDERVKELEAELAAAEIAIAEYRQQCLDNAAEIARLRIESEERLQNCAALIAENERLRKDAERIDYIEESGNFGVFRYRSGSKGPVLIEAEDGKKDINKSASTLRDAIDAVMKDAK
jgi:hypothetical protein